MARSLNILNIERWNQAVINGFSEQTIKRLFRMGKGRLGIHPARYSGFMHMFSKKNFFLLFFFLVQVMFIVVCKIKMDSKLE